MDELSGSSMYRSIPEIGPILNGARFKDRVLIGGDICTRTQWTKNDLSLSKNRNVLDGSKR